MTTESPVFPPPPQGHAVETEALKSLKFYADNYTPLMFRSLGAGNEKIVLGSEPFECRFCGGKPPESTFIKRAHAVSELLGNKILESLYECDDCNKRFSTFEDDLGKMTLATRSIGGVIGKNGIPKLISGIRRAGRKATMEFKEGGLHVSHDAGDLGFVEDEATKTLTLTYVEHPYRPLGAYKALAKSAFTLLPANELGHFPELKRWLLQADLTTDSAGGSYTCYTTFVQAFQPFKQPIVCLLKRNSKIDAPYMSFFVATGNVSYQIFLPCPSQDAHLQGKEITFPGFPHYFQLQPWLIPGSVIAGQIDLGASDRTTKRTGTMSWRYENKVKVE